MQYLVLHDQYSASCDHRLKPVTFSSEGAHCSKLLSPLLCSSCSYANKLLCPQDQWPKVATQRLNVCSNSATVSAEARELYTPPHHPPPLHSTPKVSEKISAYMLMCLTVAMETKRSCINRSFKCVIATSQGDTQPWRFKHTPSAKPKSFSWNLNQGYGLCFPSDRGKFVNGKPCSYNFNPGNDIVAHV